MKPFKATPGQRIARRIMCNMYGQPWNKEERIAAAIDRAIEEARKDAQRDQDNQK